MDALDKIESTIECINAVTKQLHYSIGKVKPYEEIEEREPIDININLFAKKEDGED